MKIKITALIFIFFMGSFGNLQAETIKISGPPVMGSLPFAVMSGENILPGIKFEFIFWNSPDQVRAMTAGKQIDGAIVTTHAAGIFHKKGIPVKIAAMFEDSLWIVSNKEYEFSDKNKIKGRFLFPFGPGEMPEKILNASTGGLPLNVEKIHTGGAFEAVNLLLLKRGDHALLSEPSASIAVKRSLKTKNPILVKSMNLKDEWKKNFNNKRLLLSCFAMFNESSFKKTETEVVLKTYKKTAVEIKKDPEKYIKIIKKKFPLIAFKKEFFDLSEHEISIFTGEKAIEDALFFLEKIEEQSKSEKPDLKDFRKNLFMEIK